jgi:Fanconi anemia group M protein
MTNDLQRLAEMQSELNEELRDSQQKLQTFSSISEKGNDSKQETDGDSQSTLEGDETSTTESPPSPQESDEIVEEAGNVEKPTTEEGERPQIIADTRETSSSVVRRLDLSGDVEVTTEQLAVGDFILSGRVAVERKEVRDFADTLVGSSDRSIFEQMGDLANNYDRPVLLIEGIQDDLYSARNIDDNAIRGAISSLAVDFGVSVLFSRSEDETASYLAQIAKREQTERDSEVAIHSKKSATSAREEQEYIVASVGEVGPVTARNLLETFETVTNVFTASIDELQEAPGVGKVTAERIYEITRAEY